MKTPKAISFQGAKCWGYIRCSHLDMVERDGLKVQNALVQRYCDALNLRMDSKLPLAEILVEPAKSAFKIPFARRPQGKRLIEQLLVPGDHLVIARMDRGFRTTQDFCNMLAYFKSRQITLHFADQQIDLSTIMGEIMATLFSLFAWWESAVKSERNKERAAWAKERGYAVGGLAPVGFVWAGAKGTVKKIVPHMSDRAIMAEIVRCRDELGMPFGRISQYIRYTYIKAAKKEPLKYPLKRDKYGYLRLTTRRQWNHSCCAAAYKQEKLLRRLPGMPTYFKTLTELKAFLEANPDVDQSPGAQSEQGKE